MGIAAQRVAHEGGPQTGAGLPADSGTAGPGSDEKTERMQTEQSHPAEQGRIRSGTSNEGTYLSQSQQRRQHELPMVPRDRTGA
jgi:hypothetical protein